jgi:ABC-type polysaccharide/polyol phosphate transport system ATPase subunit
MNTFHSDGITLKMKFEQNITQTESIVRFAELGEFLSAYNNIATQRDSTVSRIESL